MPKEFLELIPALRQVTSIAGSRILEFYNAATPMAWQAKADNSPVTEADLAADRLIAEVLATLTPEIPVISEETFSGSFTLPPDSPFWLVDPLDGTREFLARTDEFTVNIGLIVGRQPVLGVIHAPVFGETFWGIVGQGAWCEHGGVEQPISCRPAPPEGLTVVSSRYHGKPAPLNEFLGSFSVAHHYLRGSSYKFCEIASGKADLYVCLSQQLHEWDTAAGHAIVTAAGGVMEKMEGQEIIYGKTGLENPPFLVKGKVS